MEADVRKKVLLIGAVMTVFQFVLLGMAYLIWMQENPGAPLGRPYIDMALLNDPVFTGIAIAGIVAMFLGSYLGNAPQIQMDPFVRNIVAFALREFCGIAGFALAVAFKNPHICLPFVLAAVLSMVRALVAVR